MPSAQEKITTETINTAINAGHKRAPAPPPLVTSNSSLHSLTISNAFASESGLPKIRSSLHKSLLAIIHLYFNFYNNDYLEMNWWPHPILPETISQQHGPCHNHIIYWGGRSEFHSFWWKVLRWILSSSCPQLPTIASMHLDVLLSIWGAKFHQL